MSKREKVILIVMALTILGGGYIHFFSSPPEADVVSPQRGIQDLNSFMVNVAQSMRDQKLSDNDSYILATAATEWTKDPFLPSGLIVTPELSLEEKEDVFEDVTFTYSGYLNIGNRKLAIIDGMEYEAGEELNSGGYVLKSISPVQVVVGVAGGSKELILPLEETD